MDGIRYNTSLQVLVLLVCVYICVIDGVRCPYYMRRRCGGPFNCNLVRYGRRRTRYSCITPHEAFLLRQALSGGPTGPGTGMHSHGFVPPHTHNDKQPININIDLNNVNTNIHNRTNSGNTRVEQDQAAPALQCGNGCRPGGYCEHHNEICVYSDNCRMHVCRTRFIPH